MAAWRGWIEPEYRPCADAYFAGLADAAAGADRDRRTTTVVRCGDRVCVAKRHPGPPWWVWRTRAHVEARRYKRLRAAGVPVPRVLGAAYDGHAAAVFLEWLGDGPTWMEWLRAGGADRREWVAMLERTGRLVRSMHDAGFEHRDLHAGNLLVRGDRIFVVDLHRGRFRAPLDDAARIADLGFLALSISNHCSTADLWRLVAAYEDGPASRARLRSVLEAMAQARLRYARDRERRATMEGSRFERIAHGYRVRGAAEPVGERTVLKEAGRRRTLLAGGAVIKQYRRDPLRGWFERLAGTGAGEREWRNLEGFRVRGLPAPAAISYRRWLDREEVVMERIEGAETLWEYVKARYAAWGARERNAFIECLARAVRRMHERGVAHGDLKANNVLVRHEGVCFVDLDRVRTAAEIPPEWAERNLAELCAAVGPPVSRADRLRFLRAYAGNRTYWNREWKQIARRVYDLARRRRHHWP
jgi:tRNA A-37 threonylcarbamoyl transferase component Bud32